MERRRLGRTELMVSPLGFGSAPIGLLETQTAQARKIVDGLLDRGINLIDTAAVYGEAETVLGKVASKRRSEFVLISKCGPQAPHLTGEAWSADHVRQSIDASLKRLKADVIDVMLLHSCDLATLREGEAMGALLEAVDAGKVRFAGYSGDGRAAAYAATLPDVWVVETSISIADQNNVEEVLPHAQRGDVGVIAKRPIANAAWRRIEDQKGFYKKYAQDYTDRLAAMNLTPGDLGFEGASEELWPEIALRFTLSQPGVHAAIIGTTNPKHLEQNIAAAEAGPLPHDAIRKLRSAFKEAEAVAGGAWPGLT